MLHKFLALRGMVGGNDGSSEETQTYILVDEAGNEIPAVVVGEETVFTATANDIREGMVAATGDGVTVGTKEIPAYITTEGIQVTTAGSLFAISMTEEKCSFTKLQAIVCRFNSSLSNSVSAEKVSIEGKTYAVNSTEVLGEVVADPKNTKISLGVTNEGDSLCVIRYFMYKEEP